MKILHDKLVVEPCVKEQASNGLILPKSASKQNFGIVRLCGDKCKVVKVGDKIKYYDHTGVYFPYENKDCLLMNEEHSVIAVM
ncbi:hypothetical protein [Tenacibaculum sp. 190524A02b]|uniref:hypothetical protein n=1 Tax=Tenacibaculum vairaonense TaxID=3137860 RepID=UPI0031FB50E8